MVDGARTLTRRKLLQRGLFGGALLTLGGAGFLMARHGPLVGLPADGLKALSQREYTVVDAIARRMIPDAPGLPSVADVGVAERVDGIAARMDPSALTELKQLLGLFENGLVGLLFTGQAGSFTTLSAPAQDEVLADWEQSRLTLRRTGFSALRGLVMAAFYSSPKTWSAVGYPGPPGGLASPPFPSWRGLGPRPDDNGVFHPERGP
jgi:hypothetical protein